MKKILFIGELLIILAMLLGCSNKEDVDTSLIKNKLIIDRIFHIEIQMDIFKKIITNDKELNLLISYIEGIQILDSSLENIKSIEEDDIFRLNIYNKTGNIIESMSIAEEITYLNNKWYPTGIQTYDKIRTFYKNSDHEEQENEILLEINQRRISRRDKLIIKALQGIWLSENDSTIKFDKNNFKQGNQYEYVFRYDIDKIYDNNLDISIYGIKGLFVKGEKLSNYYIKMDPTKTHMIMKTIMAGGMTYYDRLVYVDQDNLRLGTFDSYFFYEKTKLEE